jgi:hypothetical protein
MEISNTPAIPFGELIKIAVLLIIPDLHPGELYTTAQLCVAIWDYLDKGEHLRAGRVISFLVATGELPLVPDSPTPSNWNRYRLR